MSINAEVLMQVLCHQSPAFIVLLRTNGVTGLPAPLPDLTRLRPGKTPVATHHYTKSYKLGARQLTALFLLVVRRALRNYLYVGADGLSQ
jgi:hypothetical protein